MCTHMQIQIQYMNTRKYNTIAAWVEKTVTWPWLAELGSDEEGGLNRSSRICSGVNRPRPSPWYTACSRSKKWTAEGHETERTTA